MPSRSGVRIVENSIKYPLNTRTEVVQLQNMPHFKYFASSAAKFAQSGLVVVRSRATDSSLAYTSQSTHLSDDDDEDEAASGDDDDLVPISDNASEELNSSTFHDDDDDDDDDDDAEEPAPPAKRGATSAIIMPAKKAKGAESAMSEKQIKEMEEFCRREEEKEMRKINPKADSDSESVRIWSHDNILSFLFTPCVGRR